MRGHIRSVFHLFTVEQFCRITIYGLITVGSVALWLADSPAMSRLLGIMYPVWAGTYAISSIVLLYFSIRKNVTMELMALPLTASGTFTYVIAVYANPPYGKVLLGVAAGSLLMVGVIVLTSRFFSIYYGKRVI